MTRHRLRLIAELLFLMAGGVVIGATVGLWLASFIT